MLKKQRAFTLIELIVTMTVVGVLIALAAPSFNRTILNNKSEGLGEDFIAQINLARYEAIKRSGMVTICASSNSTTATPTCTGSWIDGYIMFVDTASSAAATTPTVGTIIKKFEKPDAKAVISVKNNGTSVNFIRYTAMGALARVASSANPIDIETSTTGCKGQNKRLITVGLSGLVAAKKTDC